jgi:hypothetical protein
MTLSATSCVGEAGHVNMNLPHANVRIGGTFTSSVAREARSKGEIRGDLPVPACETGNASTESNRLHERAGSLAIALRDRASSAGLPENLQCLVVSAAKRAPVVLTGHAYFEFLSDHDAPSHAAKQNDYP